MSNPETIFELTIDALAHGGRGVGRHEGVVVFVPGAAPGDRLRVRVRRRRRRHIEAEIEAILEPSPARVEPPCPAFGRCGGCAWQHLDAPAQRAAKEAIVRESLEHLAGLSRPPVRPILASPQQLHYRNKMEFAFDRDGALGLHPRGRFYEVIPIERCLLCGEATEAILRAVRDYVRAHGLKGAPKRREGEADPRAILRHLVVREGRSTGEWMVALVTSPASLPAPEGLTRALRDTVPNLRSLLHVENDSRSDTVAASRVHVLYGEDHIRERLAGFCHTITLPTFFQTNTEAAEHLVRVALEMAGLEGEETVLDVFCGAGAFSLPLARRARAVYGVEIVPEAIEAARANAARAGLTNTTFEAGDARRTLPRVLEAMGTRPDLILLDPPRSGAGGKVMRRLGRSGAPTIVYVSCNPATLAPDLKWLFELGYRLERVQPLDLFPQTWHVESVALLRHTGAPSTPH